MAPGLKSAKVAGVAATATAFGTGIRKILHISTMGNTHEIYIGGSDVSTTTGFRINANQIIDFEKLMGSGYEDLDLSKVYIFSSDTEGVSYLYLERG